MKPIKAYRNPEFIHSKEARALRILAEYLEPKSRLEAEGVEDTIVFFRLGAHRAGLAMVRGGARARVSPDAVVRGLDPVAQRRFVVCTGGGPGIMEAANRGASEAHGRNVGLSISLPREEVVNTHVTRELAFHFHYFFMRKFWLAYMAKAVIVFPGGYGTLDELFEILTLVQTKRMTKRMPIVLFGTDYWREVINFDALVRHGTISAEDLNLVHRTDSVDDAYDWLIRQLTEQALGKPGAML